MFDEKEYQAVFSKVTASGETYRRVMTMKQNTKRVRIFYVRKLVIAIATIMLLMTISVTAIAAVTGAGWFEEYFQIQSKSKLSESQVNFIEENTIDYDNSVTNNGYTLSVEYALTDGYSAYLKLKLTAPQGVILSADDYGFVYKNKSQFYPADGSDISRSGSWHMENDNPDDNIVYFPMVWHGSGFDSGAKWILELEDLFEAEERSDGFLEETIISKGMYRFELVLSDVSHESVELLSEPMHYRRTIQITESEYKEENLNLTSVVLRPLSATIKFEDSEGKVAIAGKPCVVMKDGRSVDLRIRSGGNGETNYQMSAPIALEEVDHVLLPDGTKLFLSE